MTQKVLTHGELTSLLAGLGAASIVGAYGDLLLPGEDETKSLLTQQGAVSFAQPDWLEKTVGGQDGYTDLMLYVAVIASPDVVLEAIRNYPDGGRQAVTYYSAQEIVVELVLLNDDRFQLTELASFDVASARIVASWPLSDSTDGIGGATTLERAALADVERLVADGKNGQARRLLDVQGINEPMAAALLDACRSAPSEIISLLRFHGGQYLPTWRLLLYDTSHGVWTVETTAAAREVVSVASLHAIDLAQSVRHALGNGANSFK